MCTSMYVYTYIHIHVQGTEKEEDDPMDLEAFSRSKPCLELDYINLQNLQKCENDVGDIICCCRQF